MRDWLIKRLGGATKKQYMQLYNKYMHDISMWNACLEKYELQGAWEQTKLEYKQRRVH